MSSGSPIQAAMRPSDPQSNPKTKNAQGFGHASWEAHSQCHGESQDTTGESWGKSLGPRQITPSAARPGMASSSVARACPTCNDPLPDTGKKSACRGGPHLGQAAPRRWHHSACPPQGGIIITVQSSPPAAQQEGGLSSPLVAARASLHPNEPNLPRRRPSRPIRRYGALEGPCMRIEARGPRPDQQQSECEPSTR